MDGYIDSWIHTYIHIKDINHQSKIKPTSLCQGQHNTDCVTGDRVVI